MAGLSTATLLSTIQTSLPVQDPSLTWKALVSYLLHNASLEDTAVGLLCKASAQAKHRPQDCSPDCQSLAYSLTLT